MENLEESTLKTSKGKEGWIDTLGNTTYPLVVGGMLDYASGLRGWGIAASRAYAMGINVPTGALYGKWRNKLFNATKTNKESSKLRQGLVDLLAFNTFQVPIYATAIAIGSLLSEGKVDLEKVRDGAGYLAMASPLIGPTMGWYMDKLRKVFKLKSAPEKAKIK